MKIQEKIKQVIQTIFEEEGFSSDFFEPSEVKDLITDLYLTPEFREFDTFRKDPTGNELGGEGKPYREKDRRKQWTLISDFVLAVGELFAGGSSLKEEQIEILKVQTDRLLLKSEAVPELNGFFYKDGIKENVKDFMIRLFYNKIITSPISYQSLLFLDALFSKDETNLENYISKINLRDFFYPYFNNSLDDIGEFFKDIEVEKENKGMYNDIGYLNPAARIKNHTSIVAIDFSKDSDLSEYIANGLRELVSELEFPYLERPEDQPNYYRKYFNNDFVNNLASSLAKEYGNNEDVKMLFASFLSSIGYETEEIDRYLYLFVFPSLDFSECDPEPEIRDREEDTSCESDPNDPLPADWTSAQTNKVFFDEMTCSYAMSFVTEYENTQKKNITEIQNQYRKEIAKKMLTLLGKKQDEDLINKVSAEIVYKSYYINPKPLLKIRLLATVNKKDVAEIEDSLVQQGADRETFTYNIKDLFEDLDTLAEIMKFYEQRMVTDLLRGNALYYTDLNFTKEALAIEQFSLNLSQIIRPVQKYDTINIYFIGDTIDGIDLQKDGYKRRTITNGLISFATTSPQTRQRTINFVKNLTGIIEYFSENKTDTYDVFVQNYFNPEPIRKQTKNNILNYANGSPEPKGFASLGEISKRSIDFVAAEVKRGYTSFSCMDEEEKNRILQQAYSKEELLAKQDFGRQFSIQIHDRFFAQAPEIFEKISAGDGKEALNNLGKDFLNRLGVCGVGDLVALASSTLLSFLDPQEYLDELVKCAISKLDPATARKFYNKVTTSQVLSNLNQGTDFLNVYRDFVGDTLLPWELASDDLTGVQNFDENLLNLVGTDEYDLRIRAFGDSLVLSFNTEQLLDLLREVPGGEWIRYFIELSDSVIKQCKIVNNGDGILTNIKVKADFKNLCEGEKSKFKLPKMPRINKVKSKTIADAIADNAKEIIINITVKLIVSSFRELMRNVTKALSFDANFYSNGPDAPEFLQDRDYFYNIIRESSNKTSISDSQINQMFLETLAEMNISGIEDIAEDTIEGFLTNTSLVLNEKQKIDLLKGQDNYQIRQDILEANSRNGLGSLLKSDPSRIGDVFEKFGQDTNIEKLEDDLSNEIASSRINNDFCLEEPENVYADALVENKGATKEEAEEQQKERLEREKEKLCNFMDMIANPIAPIFGSALTKVLGKDGPILGLLEKEKFDIFKDVADMEYSLLSIPFEKDLNDPRDGFLQLLLHGEKGYAFDRITFFQDTIPTEDKGAYTKFSSDFSANTNFVYSPFLENNTYMFDPATAAKISLEEDKEGLNTVKIGNQKVSEYISSFTEETVIEGDELSSELLERGIFEVFVTETETRELNKTASNMYRLLKDSISISNETKKDQIIEDIVSNNMSLLIERYYGNIKREMLQSKAFTFSDWEKIKTSMTPQRVSKLLDTKGLIEDNLRFYQLLEPDERIGERKSLIYESPFDSVFTKEDYIRISITVDMLIRSYTLEAIMKSFFSFRTFSENFFERLDMFSNYVVRYMKEDLEKNYNLFANLAMQIYLKKVDLGILEVLNEDAVISLVQLENNLAEFRQAEREDIEFFIDSNMQYIEDLIADFAESSITSTIRSFRNSFSSRNVFLDQFVLGPMIENGARDVVESVLVSEDFPEIKPSASFGRTGFSIDDTDYRKTRIIMEKFIVIEEKENVPFSVSNEVQNRPDNLFGVVNLDAWKQYLNSYKSEFSSYNIDQLWKSWKFGLRLTYIMPEIIETDDTTLEERQRTKSLNVIFNDQNISLVPLVNVAKEIDNQKIKPEIVDEYEVSCLIYDMSRNPKYQKLFRETIDIETLISLITIYSVDNYANYLGEGTVTSSDLNRWQKDPEAFTNIKKSIIQILKDFK